MKDECLQGLKEIWVILNKGTDCSYFYLLTSGKTDRQI